MPRHKTASYNPVEAQSLVSSEQGVRDKTHLLSCFAREGPKVDTGTNFVGVD